MFVFSSPFRAPLIRLSVSLPVLGLALIVTPLLHAGNQSGPGWQQVEPKAKSNASPKTKPKLSANRPQKIKPPKELVGPSAFPINPQRSAPAAEDLLRDIPGNTLLREDDLVLLAIANNPELARRRSEILIARAKVKGAGDWDNPELRIGYAWDDDERLREPSVSRETEQINTSERYAQTQNQQNLAGPLEVGAGESQYQRSVGSIRTSRYRTIERSVTPGRYRDVIETKTYESRNASELNNKTTVKTKQGANFTTLEAGGKTPIAASLSALVQPLTIQTTTHEMTSSA